VPELFVPPLLHTLDSEDLDLCRNCAVALHLIGPASWGVVQEKIAHGNVASRGCLIAYLDARIPDPRTAASDSELDRMLEILALACRDPEPAIQWAAINASPGFRRRLGTDPRLVPITDSIIRLLGDAAFRKTEDESRRAFPTSEYVDESPAGRLTSILSDGSPSNRILAAETLAAVDQEDKRSTYELRQMTQDPDPKCSEAARGALRALGLSESE
jgi:hypothetical protein